jgi:hypothetical protein
MIYLLRLCLLIPTRLNFYFFKIYLFPCDKCHKFMRPWEPVFRHRPGLFAIADYYAHPKCLLTAEGYEHFLKKPEAFSTMLA